MSPLPHPRLPLASGSAREWLIAGGAGLLLSAGLVTLLRPAAPTSKTEGGDVRATARLAVLSPSPPEPPAAAPAPDISGLILRGVMGGAATGAIIVEFPGGRQARFAVGREVVPGVALKAVEPQSALLSSPGGDLRLALPGADIASLATATPLRDAGTATPDIARQTTAFRTGLAPRKLEDGRITGFTIRPDTDLPAFAQAGLKPGDVVIGINGRAFASEAEVDKLANEIRISPTIVFEYERNGKRSEARLETRQTICDAKAII